MRISIAADELTGVAPALAAELQRRGHATIAHGALGAGERCDWAWAAEEAAREIPPSHT
jgi:ribose 5-phosphate isomerase B